MNKVTRSIASLIFFSRWLQAPLYIGLIFALGMYVYVFALEIVHLVHFANELNEVQIMLGVLDLIDVVMVANLLIMVVVGGYEIFVSQLHLQDHPDHPEWLSEVNAGTMKVKLAIALVSISSIHLLKTFFEPAQLSNIASAWQVGIHLTLLVSAIAIAYTNNLMSVSKRG